MLPVSEPLPDVEPVLVVELLFFDFFVFVVVLVDAPVSPEVVPAADMSPEPDVVEAADAFLWCFL